MARIAFAFLMVFAGLARAEVDPRYVGRWRFEWTDAKGPFAIDFEVTAAGVFRTKTVGPGVLIEDEGTFEARDGRYAYASAKTPAKDHGRYEFDADGRLTATASAGPPVTWTRVDAPVDEVRAAHPSAEAHFQQGKQVYRQNKAASFPYFEKAARLGHAAAMLQVGWHHEMGVGAAKDLARAAAWYRQSALRGDSLAMKNYGQMLELGRGVPEDWVAAARWYRKAADAGEAEGMKALARAYEFGIGVPQSRATAIQLNRRAGNRCNDCLERAAWLSQPTNYIGFRNQAERDFVVDGKLRFSGELHGGDPAGQAFRNSFERNRYLLGFKAAVDADEADSWRRVADEDARRQAEQKQQSEARDREVASYIAQGYSQSAAERKADR